MTEPVPAATSAGEPGGHDAPAVAPGARPDVDEVVGLAQRRAGLTQRATAMLEGSSRLHRYVTDEAAAPGDQDGG